MAKATRKYFRKNFHMHGAKTRIFSLANLSPSTVFKPGNRLKTGGPLFAWRALPPDVNLFDHCSFPMFGHAFNIMQSRAWDILSPASSTGHPQSRFSAMSLAHLSFRLWQPQTQHWRLEIFLNTLDKIFLHQHSPLRSPLRFLEIQKWHSYPLLRQLTNFSLYTPIAVGKSWICTKT